MSVALLVQDDKEAKQRLVPVATQHVFKAKWLPGAHDLRLEWVDLMETGFDITKDNQRAVVEELGRLREWLNSRSESYEVERLDRLVAELRVLRFDSGATAFLG